MEQLSKGISLLTGKDNLVLLKRTSLCPDELYQMFSLLTPLLLPTNQLVNLMSNAPDGGSLKSKFCLSLNFIPVQILKDGS